MVNNPIFQKQRIKTYIKLKIKMGFRYESWQQNTLYRPNFEWRTHYIKISGLYVKRVMLITLVMFGVHDFSKYQKIH